MKWKESHSWSALLFLAGTFLALAACLLGPDREFSPQENRSLEQRPVLSLEGVFSGTYMKDFEKYVSDQFPLRDFFVHAQAASQRWMGKQENNGVYFGKGGNLFQQFSGVERKEIESKAKAMASLAEHGSGAKVYLMLVPSAGAVLSEQLPPFVSFDPERQAVQDLANQTKETAVFVDPYAALEEHRQEEIYYRTDHHWTTLGAYYGWQELARRMQLSPQILENYTPEIVSDHFYGSLYSQSGYPFVEPDQIRLFHHREEKPITVSFSEGKKRRNTLYELENLEKKDQYTVFLGGNDSFLRVDTGSLAPRKLLILKDSFANCFVPFLTRDFKTIDLVDLRYYNEDISQRMKREGYTDILVLYSAKTFFEEKTPGKMAW